MSFGSILRRNYEKQIANSLQHSGRMADITDIMEEKRFFPQNPDDDANIIYINPSSRDCMWKDYQDDIDFRTSINKFYFDPASHQEYQKRILDQIKVANNHQEFWNFEIIGDPGSGKSTWVRGYVIPTHAFITARNFLVHCDIDGMENNFPVDMKQVMSNFPDVDISKIPKFDEKPPFDACVTYDNSQTNRSTKILKRGDVIFQDESPVQHGKGSRTSVDNLENILKVPSRALGLCFAFISPTYIPIETVHYYCRIIGYVRAQKITVISLQTKNSYVGVAEFQAVDIPGLSEYYERVSRAKKKELQESSGYSSYKPSEKELKEMISELIDACNSAMDEDGIEKISKDYVRSIAMRIDRIRSSIDKDDVIARAYRVIQGGGSGDISTNASTPNPVLVPVTPAPADQSNTSGAAQPPATPYMLKFDVTKEMLLDIVKTDIKNPTAARYFIDCLDHKPEDVAVTYSVSQSDVIAAYGRVNLTVQQSVGRRYEVVYAAWLRTQPHVKKDGIYKADGGVIHNGKPSEWDIIQEMDDGSFNVISVKWRNPRFDARTSFSIEEKEILPEIIQARIMKENEGKKVQLILHIRVKDHDKTQDEIIDIYKHKKTFTYKEDDFK
jgi:hypothetical protein